MATIRYMKDLEAQFINVLNSDLEKEARLLMKALEKEIVFVLSKSIMYSLPRDGRRGNGFSNAKVVFSKRNILTTKHGVKLEIEAFVADKSNRPHKVWHELNRGYSSYTVKKTVRFPIRKNQRTSPNDMQARPFQGFTGQWRTAKKGTLINGLAARNFYATAMEQIIDKIEKEYAPYKINGVHKD